MQHLKARNTTTTRLAENHARQMFLYYFLRAQLETPGLISNDERAVIHNAAVESRRFGFRLEASAANIGLKLGEYDEEHFRRESYRAAHLQATDAPQAAEIERRLIDETVSFALTDVEMNEFVPLAHAA